MHEYNNEHVFSDPKQTAKKLEEMKTSMSVLIVLMLFSHCKLTLAGLFGPEHDSPFIKAFSRRLSLSGSDLQSELEPSQCSLPMTARNVSIRCIRYLTRVEREELKDVDTVWYFSPLSHRIRANAAEADLETMEGFPSLLQDDQLDFRYKIGEPISEGSEGTVVRAYDMSQDGKLVAVKFIRKERDSRYEIRLLHQMVDSMSDIHQDPHVIEPIQHIEYRGWDVWVFPYFSSDWYQVLANEPVIPLARIQKLTVDMLTALDFLKSCKIVHLDIKPENIMYDSVTDSSYLADFGLSLHENEMLQQADTRGTFEFMPPELQLNSKTVSYEADMWSLGATMFTLLTGSDLINLENMEWNERESKTIKRLRLRVPPETDVINGNIKIPLGRQRSIDEIRSLWFISGLERALVEKYHDEVKSFNQAADFINRCLLWDPKNRLTVEQALKHPFVRELSYIKSKRNHRRH